MLAVPLSNPAQFHLRPANVRCPRCQGGNGLLCHDCAPVKLNDYGFSKHKGLEKPVGQLVVYLI